MARAKMRGRKELLKKLAALPPAVRSEIKQALAQAADELVEAQKRLAPVRSGKLKNSIVQTWGGGKVRYSSLSAGSENAGDPDLTVTVSAGNDQVRYAHLVEFGTAPHPQGGLFKGTEHPGTDPQPFFFPPYRAQKKRIKSRISRATTRAAKKVAAGRT